MTNGVSLAVISGGTAANSFCRELLSETENVSYILPVSDDGGSTAEIIRVLGGPAIGDIRSRLVRLSNETTPESKAVIKLLHHRLPVVLPRAKRRRLIGGEGDEEAEKVNGEKAMVEEFDEDDQDSAASLQWLRIVKGNHPLWEGISDPYKHIIRSFLVHFNTQILVRAKQDFDFSNGSVGNFFFTGARLFFGSLEAAIFLFSSIARIPAGTTVLPVIDLTFDRCTLGAQLVNGQIVIGQNQISHPHQEGDGANLVHKGASQLLDAPIQRIFYVNREGRETVPKLNPRVATSLQSQRAVVYSIGSLYSSIIPCLILPGVGQAILGNSGRKLLLLNGSNDRETEGMTALDFILAITKALNDSLHSDSGPADQPGKEASPPGCFVTHLIYLEEGRIHIDHDKIKALGIGLVGVKKSKKGEDGSPLFPPTDLVSAIVNTATT